MSTTWSGFDWIDTDAKVAHPVTGSGDLRVVPADATIALTPAGVPAPAVPDLSAAQLWVSTSPMAETVKRVVDGRVAATVPREQLLLASYPLVCRGGLLRQCARADPLSTLQALLDTAQEVRALPAGPADT